MIRSFFYVVLLTFCFVTVPKAQIKVACIGNSITEGWGLADPSTQSYPSRLQVLLGSGYSVQNDGASGRTMLKSDAKNSYWIYGKLAQALAFKPSIVTIKLGTNDANNFASTWNSISAEFKLDYLAMIDTFKTLSVKPKVFPVLPVPIRGNNDSVLVKAIAIIKQIALDRGLTVIDCYTPLKGQNQLYYDNLHPNAVGADTLAHVFYRAITSSTQIVYFAENANARTSPTGTSLVPVFAGNNITAIFARLVPGQHYEIRAFNTNGALVDREIVEKASEHRESFLSSLKSTPAIRWVSVRRL